MKDAQRERVKRVFLVKIRLVECFAVRMHDLVGLIVNHES